MAPTQSTDPRPVPPGIASGGKTGRKGRKRASTGERGPSYQDLWKLKIQVLLIIQYMLLIQTTILTLYPNVPEHIAYNPDFANNPFLHFYILHWIF